MPLYYTSVLITQSIYSPQLHREVALRILLPKAYFRYSQRHFSVIYMQDGQNLFEHHTAFNRAWGLKEVIDAMPLSKQFIIVGLDNAHFNRASEYTPSYGRNIQSKSNEYIEFIILNVKNNVDNSFRTLPDRVHTMIAGSSLGGLMAFYAATRYSHVFGKAGVFSLAFWLRPEVLIIPKGHPIKMYIVGSQTESSGMKNTLVQTYWSLRNSGWPETSFRVVIKDRGKHNEFFWGRNFRNMALFLMEG